MKPVPRALHIECRVPRESAAYRVATGLIFHSVWFAAQSEPHADGRDTWLFTVESKHTGLLMRLCEEAMK